MKRVNQTKSLRLGLPKGSLQEATEFKAHDLVDAIVEITESGRG